MDEGVEDVDDEHAVRRARGDDRDQRVDDLVVVEKVEQARLGAARVADREDGADEQRERDRQVSLPVRNRRRDEAVECVDRRLQRRPLQARREQRGAAGERRAFDDGSEALPRGDAVDPVLEVDAVEVREFKNDLQDELPRGDA